ncbi:flagellar hook assembly protein FlgD [Sphingosinicella terrae]|uniref:flagellar hook assembly protein FlgD n=1 Tax=Sphingosinicella terrae TaxID=2172047 RepID=UPI000E0E072E|nr:flagellar hook capping FlgD N-terminal domain-containing protein [Sphingosinicella terrae]
MTVTNATGVAAGQNAVQNAPGGLLAASSADFDMFLKLLTTQMQNQDPLDPMDTSEYTQQLVQYSQVEQSIQQTGVLRDILSRLSAQDMAQASGFIGREAQFDTAVAGLGEAPAQWTWSLPPGASSVEASIVDASGRTVSTRTLDASADSGRFVWDGSLTSGGTAPAGAYMLQLKATDASGATVPVTIRSVGVVDSVTAEGGNLTLGVNGISVAAGSLVHVAAASPAA